MRSDRWIEDIVNLGSQISSFRPKTLLKKRLWHRFFPVNFVKFLRTLFCIKHLWWLILKGKNLSIKYWCHVIYIVEIFSLFFLDHNSFLYVNKYNITLFRAKTSTAYLNFVSHKLQEQLITGVENKCFQKQPPEVLYKKVVLKNFPNFTGKHLCWSLRPATLKHRCFPVKFVKFLRTLILKKMCELLLLCFEKFPQILRKKML